MVSSTVGLKNGANSDSKVNDSTGANGAGVVADDGRHGARSRGIVVGTLAALPVAGGDRAASSLRCDQRRNDKGCGGGSSES
jgi:hypothetical protein